MPKSNRLPLPSAGGLAAAVLVPDIGAAVLPSAEGAAPPSVRGTVPSGTGRTLVSGSDPAPTRTVRPIEPGEVTTGVAATSLGRALRAVPNFSSDTLFLASRGDEPDTPRRIRATCVRKPFPRTRRTCPPAVSPEAYYTNTLPGPLTVARQDRRGRL
jgi:hypothetical protein